MVCFVRLVLVGKVFNGKEEKMPFLYDPEALCLSEGSFTYARSFA